MCDEIDVKLFDDLDSLGSLEVEHIKKIIDKKYVLVLTMEDGKEVTINKDFNQKNKNSKILVLGNKNNSLEFIDLTRIIKCKVSRSDDSNQSKLVLKCT